MSTIGHGYGSEWHLLRWLGYHRDKLNEIVCDELAADAVEWCDLRFNETPRGHFDRECEWRGVDFLLAEEPEAARSYRNWWPTTGNVPNWDAVGRREIDGQTEWLLVEAKAHLGELDQQCTAKGRGEGGSREVIAGRLDEVKAAIAPGNPNDWLAHYYQYANRLATLLFLLEHGHHARLLHICFLGDDHFRDAAYTESEWRHGRGRTKGVDAMEAWVGRPFAHGIEHRLHDVFLAVDPKDASV